MKTQPNAPDTLERVWMRCLIAACVTCLIAVFWSSHEPRYVYSAIKSGAGPIGTVAGLLLLFSSIGWFWTDRRLAIVGCLISFPSICLSFLPELAA
jgi:hypothetical protein